MASRIIMLPGLLECETFIRLGYDLFVTHSGSHHADEVLAGASWLATLSQPFGFGYCTRNDTELVTLKGLPNVVMCDVGNEYCVKKRVFDHHKDDGLTHDDGLPFSSFGLWMKYRNGGHEHPLVRHVDGVDNGIATPPPDGWPRHSAAPGGDSVAFAVHHSNPCHLDGSPVTEAEFAKRFGEMVELAVGAFGRDGEVTATRLDTACESQMQVWHRESVAAQEASALRVKKVVEAFIQPILVLDQFELAAIDIAAQLPHVMYVVFPGVDGGWMTQQVPVKLGGFEGRKPLPEAWAGLRGAEFEAIVGHGGVFCHKGRWICGHRTKEGAIGLAKAALAA